MISARPHIVSRVMTVAMIQSGRVGREAGLGAEQSPPRQLQLGKPQL